MNYNSRITLLLLAGTLWFSTTVSGELFNREIDRQFNSSDFKKLEIRIPNGSIHAETGLDTVVRIEIDLETNTGNAAKADEFFDSTEVLFDDSGDNLLLAIKNPKRKGMFSLFRRNRNSVKASVKLILPRNFDVHLHTGSGMIHVNGLMGNLVFDTGSGNVLGGNLTGEIIADTGSGNVVLDIVEGNLTVDTGSGNIEVTNFDGAFHADTGSGSINASGNIHQFTTDTGSGSINIQSFAELKDRSVADTGSGSIRIHLPAAAAFNLDADVGSGRIECNFPLEQVEQKKNSLKALVNGGGPILRLDSGSGNILVQPN